MASRTSSISAPVESVLATHASPGSSVGPTSSSAARSHQATSTPADASGAAIVHARSTPRRSSQVVSSSSSSASRIGSGFDGRGATCCRSSSSCAKWSAVRSPSASRRSEASSDEQTASRASTERVAAAAGLLSSCARPAASVPSVTSDCRCRTVDSMLRAVA